MALLNNYLSPYGQVRLFDLNGGKELLLGSKDSGHAPPFVTDITIVIIMDRSAQISFSIDSPYSEGVDFLNENWLSIGNVIAARIGYSGTKFVTPWFYGMIAQGGAGVSITSEGVTGGISAVTYGDHYLRAFKPSQVSGGGYQTAKDVLELCFRTMGLRKIEIAPGALAALTGHQNTTEFLIGTKSIWDMVVDTCKKFDCRFWFGVSRENGQFVQTAYVLTTAESERAVPVRKYVLRGNFLPLENQYPLLEYGPLGPGTAVWDAAFLDSRGTGFTAAWINERGAVVEATATAEDTTGGIDEKMSSADATPSDTEETKSGTKTNASLEGGEKQDHARAPIGVPDGTSVETVKQGLEAQRMQSGNAFQASLSVLGSPLQLPSENVLVHGCSKRFDGVYNIQGVTHSFGRGQFDSTLTAKKLGTFGPAGKDEQPGTIVKRVDVEGASFISQKLGFGPGQM